MITYKLRNNPDHAQFVLIKAEKVQKDGDNILTERSLSVTSL